MEYGEAVREFEEFFSEHCYERVAEAVQEGKGAIVVDVRELDTFNFELYEFLRQDPDSAIRAAEEGVEGHSQVTGEDFNVRFANMPEEDFVKIKNLRSKHIGKFIPLEGMIKRASQVKPEVVSAIFECTQCGDRYEKEQDSSKLKSPYKCDCGSRKFEVDEKVMTDTQNIVLEENPESREGSEQPAEINVRLEGDLVEPDFQKKVVPGNVAHITGTIRETPFKKDSKKFDMYVDANHLDPVEREFEELTLEDEEIEEIKELAAEEDVFDRITRSIAPSIYGHHQVKKAIALQLFGGVRKTREDGVKSRGDIHILLIGEPGTGKSQMLKFTGELAPKGRYVVGKSSSGAGLCVSGDTMVHTQDGFKQIEEIVEKQIDFPVKTETAKETDEELYTYNKGNIESKKASLMWKMPERECVEIETSFGKSLEASRNTDILVCGENGIEWKKINQIQSGDFIAAPSYKEVDRENPDVLDYFEFSNEKIKLGSRSVEKIRRKMKQNYGSLRQAARHLEISENFVYDTLKNRRAPFKKLDYVLDEIEIELGELEIEDVMIRHGDKVEIPERFDRDLMYLAGLVFGDGDISLTEKRGMVRISNGNKEILETAAEIIEDKFGKNIEIETQEDRVPCIRLHSRTVAEFFSKLGMQKPKEGLELDEKLTTSKNADSFLRGLMDADGSVVQRENGSDSVQMSTVSKKLGKQVQLMMESYGIKAKKRLRDRKGVYELEDGRQIESKSEQTHLVIRGRSIDRFRKEIGFSSTRKSKALEKITGKKRNSNNNILPVNQILSKSSAKTGEHWTYFNQDTNPGKERAEQILEDLDLEQKIEQELEEITGAELNWEKVTSVERTGKKQLYDLTVPESHNFFGNGIVTHNTAAAVRNEQTGEFELEAGAVVLAHKGMAAVDEIDKMSSEDRSSLHEAMEQQQISVAKANIQATLNAQTSILAAGNPKHGRFDPYEPVAQQIDLGDTLLSRFDFIFPVKDEPDKEKDTKLSEQILKNHIEPEDMDAEVDSELLRKYVAYAKKNVRPGLTQEAADKIQDFYVGMREGGDEEGESVPITARQLEAIIRVAEASARAELREEVTEKDAQRAIDILTYCLKQIGVDPETGDYDIDMIETGTSTSQRNRLQTMKQIIRSAGGEDEAVEVEEVIEKAEQEGLEKDKAEEIINRLKREGDLWEPQPGHIQQV